MKALLRKLLSAALAGAVLASCLPAYASNALGHDLLLRDTALSSCVRLADGTFWSDSSSDLRRENYVVYTPSERVTPVVYCGDTTRALTTTPAAAAALEARGWRVAAGINGDYYGVAHGVPLGSTMAEGELRNANGDSYYAVGFRADGTAIIGDPQLAMTVSVNGGEGFPVFAFNHIRQSGFGIFLYDHRFNDRGTTDTSEPGVDVICTAEGGRLSIGGALTLRVEEVLAATKETTVEAGKYILSANLKAGEEYTAPLLALQPGDELTLRVGTRSGSTEWNDVVNLVGAPELIVENGKVPAGLPAGSAPRTAIGQRADGSLIFYTIDGRQSGFSIGATLTAVGLRLIELGCVTAVALDGGGSTTLAATLPNETAAHAVNSPSEGKLRAVSNHIFLVEPNTPSGVPDHVYLSAAATRALPGASVSLTAAVIDTNDIPMDAPVTLSASAGRLDGTALTLPADIGTVTVSAESGKLRADAEIDVLAPAWITLYNGRSAVTSLTLAPERSASLTAKGIYMRLPLAGDNRCFTWTYEGEGVTLAEDGTLTAGKDAASGTLTVSAAGVETSIPVTVATVPFRLLSSFEDIFEPLTDAQPKEPEEDAAVGTPVPAPVTEPAPVHLTLSRAIDAAHVRFGRAAGRLDYALDGLAAATIPLRYSVSSAYNCVELWVCGDGGPEALSLETDAGASSAAAIDFTGWASVTLSLPAGARTITGLTLNAPEAAGGVIWLDQLVLAYDDVTDAAAPEGSPSVQEEAGLLTGRAFDALDGAALTTLRLSCDGAALPFERDSRTGALTAALPEADGLAHNITLTAGDASGNLARASVFLPAAEDLPPAFPDAEGHWAAGMIEFLKRTGVSNGSDNGLYKPDSNITRQEFAVMLYRYLEPDGNFTETALAFADVNDIAPWALDAARAMSGLGVVNGSKDADGKLRYKPRANITRQEAVTMLGRLLEKGYTVPALPYADSKDIPDWAAPHVAVLGAAGVFDDFVTDAFRPKELLTRAEMAAMLLRLS